MPIDTSIYQNLATPEIKIPDPMEMAQKAITLKQLGLQSQQMQREMQMQQVMRQAYAENTDPTGKINQPGVYTSLAKMGAPSMIPQAQNSFSAMNKADAEAKAAQAESVLKTYNITGPAFEYAAGMKEADRAKYYPKMIQNLKDQGIDVSKMDHPYDPSLFSQYFQTWQKTKPALENYLTEANIGKTLSEIGEKKKGRLTDYQKILEGNDIYKKSTGSLSQGQNALTAIEDAEKNPQSRSNLPLMLARFTTEGQRMNEQEIERNIKSGTFGDRLKQMYYDAQNGVLSPQMANYARQFVSSQMGSSAKNKASIEKDIAGKYAVDEGISHDEAYKRLTAQAPGTVSPTPQTPPVDNRSPKDKKSGNGLVKSAFAGEGRGGPHGMIVKQNGHNYTWNAKTGSYE